MSEIYIHKFVKKDCVDDEILQNFIMLYFPTEQSIVDDITKFQKGQKSVFMPQIKPNDNNNRTRVLNLYQNRGIAKFIEKDVTYFCEDMDDDYDLYIAYAFADNEKLYLDIAVTFSIVDAPARKRAGSTTIKEESTKVLQIRYLARFLSGQSYFIPRGSKTTIYSRDLMKRVLKFAKEVHDVSVVTFLPVSKESVEMWKSLAKNRESEPFNSLPPNGFSGRAEDKTTADMDLFKLEYRICSECNWFATYTCDHVQFKNKLFFCGKECFSIKFQE
jgi:hypothetical protein